MKQRNLSVSVAVEIMELVGEDLQPCSAVPVNLQTLSADIMQYASMRLQEVGRNIQVSADVLDPQRV